MNQQSGHLSVYNSIVTLNSSEIVLSCIPDRKLRHYFFSIQRCVRLAATVVHILLDTESCSDLSLISIYTVVGSFASLVNPIVRVFSIGFKIHFTPFRTIKNIRRQPTIITTKFSGFISFWYNSVFFFELSVGDTHDLVNTE